MPTKKLIQATSTKKAPTIKPIQAASTLEELLFNDPTKKSVPTIKPIQAMSTKKVVPA